MKIIAWVILVAMLALGSGCAHPDWIDRTLVTVDVTGTWEGSASSGAFFQLKLEQRGTRVQGSSRRMGGVSYSLVTLSGPIEGTVAGDVFTFRQTNGSVTGEMRVSGDEMTGQLLGGLGTSPVTLRRADSSPPASLPKP
jgi:hypothetical protein